MTPALEAIARIRQQPALMALTDLPIWACSGGTLPNGKPNKAPRDYRAPWKHGKSNDPATWGTLDQIEEAARGYPALVHHVGIMTGPHARVLDWDYKPHDTQPGIVRAQAARFAHCYQETSLSGRGLRCVFLADGLDFKKQKHDLAPGVELEVFASHQYAILTGHTTNPAPLTDGGEALTALLGELAPLPTSTNAAPRRALPRANGQHGDELFTVAAQTWRVTELLERYGYPRKGPGRYLAPTSSTGLAGVTVYRDEEGRERCYSHHASDPLNNGHANDAFDVFAILEHGGNYSAAAKHARELLGLTRQEQPTTPAATTYTREEVTALWEAHGSEVLERAMQYVSDAHHKAKDAMIALLATTYHAASEGNISETPRGWAVEVGGLKTFSALLGCKPGDLRARLDLASDHGLIGGAYRIKPEDPRSGYRITLPADPRALRFLTLGKPAAPLRPETTSVRRGRNGLSAPRNKKQGVAGVPINPAKPKNPLRALLRVALTLSRHPGLTPKELATRLGMRLDTTRRKLSELNALGYLTGGGALRCTFRQFFEDMRAAEGEHARLRLYTVLEKQIEYARRSLRAARLGDAAAKRAAPRMKKLEGRAYGRLERLRYGEAAHAVLGVAA